MWVSILVWKNCSSKPCLTIKIIRVRQECWNRYNPYCHFYKIWFCISPWLQLLVQLNISMWDDSFPPPSCGNISRKCATPDHVLIWMSSNHLFSSNQRLQRAPSHFRRQTHPYVEHVSKAWKPPIEKILQVFISLIYHSNFFSKSFHLFLAKIIFACFMSSNVLVDNKQWKIVKSTRRSLNFLKLLPNIILPKSHH